MPVTDRRRSTRVAFQTTATLRFRDDEYPACETDNLSLKGVFIKGVTGRTPGEECAVELRLAGTSSDLRLHMQAAVVRSGDDGVALRFQEVDLDSFYHLKNIIYYNVEDPASLDREFHAAADTPEDFQGS